MLAYASCCGDTLELEIFNFVQKISALKGNIRIVMFTVFEKYKLYEQYFYILLIPARKALEIEMPKFKVLTLLARYSGQL